MHQRGAGDEHLWCMGARNVLIWGGKALEAPFSCAPHPFSVGDGKVYVSVATHSHRCFANSLKAYKERFSVCLSYPCKSCLTAGFTLCIEALSLWVVRDRHSSLTGSSDHST